MGRTNSKILASAAKEYLADKSTREIKRITGTRKSHPRKRRRRKVLSASVTWQKWEIEFLGTDIDKKVAKQIGRSHRAVSHKREKLGIPPFHRQPSRRDWTEDEIALLGQYPDSEVARRLGRSFASVNKVRKRLKIPCVYTFDRWSAKEIAWLA